MSQPTKFRPSKETVSLEGILAGTCRTFTGKEVVHIVHSVAIDPVSRNRYEHYFLIDQHGLLSETNDPNDAEVMFNTCRVKTHALCLWETFDPIILENILEIVQQKVSNEVLHQMLR